MAQPSKRSKSHRPYLVVSSAIMAMVGVVLFLPSLQDREGSVQVDENLGIEQTRLAPPQAPEIVNTTQAEPAHTQNSLPPVARQPSAPPSPPVATRIPAAPSNTLVSALVESISSIGKQASPVDPHLTMGSGTCVKCHEGEVRVWQNTPHFRTFDELHRRPEAKQIAAKLGVRSIKHDGRCTDCHYTQKTELASGSPHVIEGISCESCHGSAKNWLDAHHNYGGEHITRATESPQHRMERLSRSIQLGMRNPVNVYLVAQSCLRCHSTPDEELVNVGGHPTGSLDFEIVSWSQGTIRHNFVRTDGQNNDVSSLPRLRLMFVSGMIAELEAGLRATANATQKATFGITSAQRTSRAIQRLKSVSQKVDSRILGEVLGIVGRIELKLNNKAQLDQAAEIIAMLGYQFASETDPQTLSPLDAFVPSQDRWK